MAAEADGDGGCVLLERDQGWGLLGDEVWGNRGTPGNGRTGRHGGTAGNRVEQFGHHFG